MSRALLLAVACVVLSNGCACWPRAGRPAGAMLESRLTGFEVVSPVEYRWGDQTAWSTAPSLADEPPGRGRARRLEVRFQLPPGDWVDPTLFLSSCVYLVRAEVGGRVLESPGAFVPLRRSDLGHEVRLTFESSQVMREGALLVGSQSHLRREVSSAEGSVLWVGFTLAVLSAILAVLAARRGPEAALLARASVIALTIGLLILQQTTTAVLLIPVPLPVMRAARDVAVFVCSASFLSFFALAVPENARPLKWFARLVLVSLVVVVVLDLVGVVSLLMSARFGLGLLMNALAVSAIHLARARKRSPVARRLLWGVVIVFLFSVPDFTWALFGYQLINASVAHLGLLPMMAAMVLAVQDRFRDHRDALEGRVRDIERLNEELRFQVEARSRELKDALAARPLAKAREWAEGDVLNERYRLGALLGRGGMAQVFAATRVGDGKRFALKLLAGEVTRGHVARFAREAETAARLRHPNLVPVVDVGVVDEGQLYLVMELVAGQNLEQARARFGDEAWARRVLRGVTEGLVAVHEAGVVHRDLKPANVLLDGDVARVTDFGVAGREAASLDATVTRGSLTQTGALIGTPRYLAPEVLAGQPATRASDCFALGLLAFELLTARYPFEEPPFVARLAGRGLVRSVPDDALPEALRGFGAFLALDPSARPTVDAARALLGHAGAAT